MSNASPRDDRNQMGIRELPVYFTNDPNVSALIAQYEKCSPVSNGWNRLTNNEQTRFARWSPQWPDNKKYDTQEAEAKPFNACSDVRVFLVDDVITKLVSMLVVSFWRSVELVSGTESSDNEQAANVSTLFRWMLGTKQKRDLISEVELSAQYFLTYGRGVLHPYWRRELELTLRRVTMEQLVEMAQKQREMTMQQGGGEFKVQGSRFNAEGLMPLEELVMAIGDPTMEDVAVDLVISNSTKLTQTWFKQAFGEEEMPVELQTYEVTRKRARTFVRQLRDTGAAGLPLPYFCKNEAAIKCLKPWEEVYLPAGVTDIQFGPVFHVRWLTELQLRHEALLGGWKQEWVEEAVKCKGQYSTWTQESGQTVFDPDMNWTFGWNSVENEDKTEVIHASYWQLDDNEDVKVQVETIFHAKVGDDLFAKHGPVSLPHRQLPYVLGLMERPDRRIDGSRSMPEKLASRQREMKVQRDAIIDRTSISVSPPVNVYDTGLETDFMYGPFAQNTVTPGREPKLMDIPATDGGKMAFELMAMVRMEVADIVGDAQPDGPTGAAVAQRQMLVNSFLMMWSQAFQQQFALMQAYLPPEEYQRITGDTKPLPKGDDIAKQYDFILTFDARELEMEHVMKQFEAITKGVLPIDTENVISRGKLAKAMVRAINPQLAQEIAMGPEEGEAALMRKVRNDMLLMFTGNDPDYGVDDNPAAETQLMMMQRIIQGDPNRQVPGNLKYQKALMEDQDFAERVQKYQESLQFNVQQQANKKIGRTGVK